MTLSFHATTQGSGVVVETPNILPPLSVLVASYNDDGTFAGWLDPTAGGGHVIEDNGTPLPQRSALNFIGATVTDDAVEDATVVTIDAGGGGGSGDVVGPASATDNAIARFDSTTGKLVQNSVVTLNDSGSLAFPDNQGFFANTSDGSDTSNIGMCGGGSLSVARGGFVEVSGNEHPVRPGAVEIAAGTASDDGAVRIITGISVNTRLEVSYAGVTTISELAITKLQSSSIELNDAVNFASSANAYVRVSRGLAARNCAFTWQTSAVDKWSAGLIDSDVGAGTSFFIGQDKQGTSPAIEVDVNDKTILSASKTSGASLNIPSGTAPSSPVDGDVWSDGSDILVRLGGVTYTLNKT